MNTKAMVVLLVLTSAVISVLVTQMTAMPVLADQYEEEVLADESYPYQLVLAYSANGPAYIAFNRQTGQFETPEAFVQPPQEYQCVGNGKGAWIRSGKYAEAVIIDAKGDVHTVQEGN